MKSVTQIKSIIFAAVTVLTLVSATGPRVMNRLSTSGLPVNLKIECVASKASLLIQLGANGVARIGVEKRVKGQTFKMLTAESSTWFESNGSIQINEQIQIDSATGVVSIFANVLPTEFAVASSLCHGSVAVIE
jgi:hypothetical protein